MTTPKQHCASGRFKVVHCGPSHWEVRVDGKPVARKASMGNAMSEATWMNELEKSGDQFGVLQDILKQAGA
jgi:hypothetical protein